MSAKYKGAFCEAKVRSVDKLVKCRVTFKMGLGSTTISDKDIKTDKREDMFAATPPSEALKMLLSAAMTEGIGYH